MRAVVDGLASAVTFGNHKTHHADHALAPSGSTELTSKTSTDLATVALLEGGNAGPKMGTAHYKAQHDSAHSLERKGAAATSPQHTTTGKKGRSKSTKSLTLERQVLALTGDGSMRVFSLEVRLAFAVRSLRC